MSINSRRRLFLFALLLAAICAAGVHPASAGFVSPGTLQGPPRTIPEDSATPQENAPLTNAASFQLIAAVSRGLWSKACAMATRTLADQTPDTDALGVFAICQALRNDKTAAGVALARLGSAEDSTTHYGQIARGVLLLRSGSADAADASFKSVLDSDPGDPLALYFRGEASHARHRDAEAVAAFRKSLQRWPDNAAALTAIARLISGPNASRANLNAAIDLTEHATAIEPTNTDYWKQMAALYDRVGRHDRATAVTLQWLTKPPVK
jgi:tetratricopeptide (TPR) repeat protein